MHDLTQRLLEHLSTLLADFSMLVIDSVAARNLDSSNDSWLSFITVMISFFTMPEVVIVVDDIVTLLLCFMYSNVCDTCRDIIRYIILTRNSR